MLQGLKKVLLFALLYACPVLQKCSLQCRPAAHSENLYTHHSSSADLFFQKQALKASTKEKTKHFKSQGDGEHARAHNKAHTPCRRNMIFQSLNLLSSDTLLSSRIYTPFLCTYIMRNTYCSSRILLVAIV